MIPSKPAERLCLQRDGAQNIVIDLPTTLPQHQIDGIRFLFKLFKKKAPGAILNDPSGYGKCLQVVLFLNSVRSLLTKPILVLSNSVDNWVEHFQIWTNCYDDLAIKESNPFSKSRIFVSEIQEGAALSRRPWSVVVSHDEGSAGELLKMSFNADYRIWVTSDDLKENLYTLAAVYECLHPNQRFNVELFTAQQNSQRDIIEKALLLDASLEDFLLRRTDFLTPFQKYKNLKSNTSPEKVSRKNKDPTGTKVKRSKRRRILGDDDNSIETNRQTIIRNNEVLNEVFVSNNNDNNIDNNVIESNGKETSEISVNVAESMDIDFTAALKEIEINENKSHSMDQSQSLGSPVIHRNTENSGTQEYMPEIEENDNKDDRNGILVPATEESSDLQSIFAGEANTTQKDNKKVTNDQYTRKSVVYIPETESENVFSNVLEEGESARSENIDFKISDNVVKEQSVSYKGNDSSKSIHEDKLAKNNDNMNSKAKEIMKKTSKLDEFDAELAAFEAKALRKIKGSILDSLF